MSRRIQRRAFLGASAAGVVAAAAGATGLFLQREDNVSQPTIPPDYLPPATPTTVPTPTSPRPGGSQTITAPGRLNFDTFDAQLTGESSVVEALGRTHSRLVQWDGGSITGDLAARRESPDPQTLVLHLNPGARWQPKPPLNGRVVTADDVVANLTRAVAIAAGGKAPLAQRYHNYSTIASVDSPATGQVRVRLSRPDPFLLDTLASEFALVQAPEAVAAFAALWTKLDSDHVVGSGPWLFDWTDGGLGFRAWRDGHQQPLLDELHVVEPADTVKRFVDGSLDEAIVFDRRDAAGLRSNASATFAGVRPQRELVMSSLFIGAPPWNNPGLVTALSDALNRQWLVDTLFGGRAEHAGPVPSALANNATPANLLATLPGYGAWSDMAGAGARARWEAAGGPGLGTVTVDFPSVFDPLYSASSIIVAQLNAVLGPQFRPAVETYTTISKRVLAGQYGTGRTSFWFGWGVPLSSPDSRRFVAETYAAGSPGQRTVGGQGVPNPEDALAIADAGFAGVLHWAHPYHEVFRKRLIAGPEPTAFWAQHLDSRRTNR